MQLALPKTDRGIHVAACGQTSSIAEALLGPESQDSAIILGDANQALRQFPSGVFQTCVTSPPY